MADLQYCCLLAVRRGIQSEDSALAVAGLRTDAVPTVPYTLVEGNTAAAMKDVDCRVVAANRLFAQSGTGTGRPIVQSVCLMLIVTGPSVEYPRRLTGTNYKAREGCF